MLYLVVSSGPVARLAVNWLLSKWTRSDETPSVSYTPAPVAAPVAPQRFMAGGVDVAAAAMAGFSVKGDDDIIIIEGIGPKIAELFKANGVSTFAQIAKMSVPEMSSILDKGGSRFKLANPGSRHSKPSWLQRTAGPSSKCCKTSCTLAEGHR